MRKVKWFLAEFFVVVSGVIVAFVINNLWQDFKDLNREKEYIVQIYRELDSTKQALLIDESHAKRSTLAAAQLLSYCYLDSLPTEDRILNNFFSAIVFNTSSHSSGILTSIINWGQLPLIENKSLRTTLVELATELNDFKKVSKDLGYQKLWGQIMTIIQEIDMQRVILAYMLPEAYEKHVRSDSLSPFFEIERPEVPPCLLKNFSPMRVYEKS